MSLFSRQPIAAEEFSGASNADGAGCCCGGGGGSCIPICGCASIPLAYSLPLSGITGGAGCSGTECTDLNNTWNLVFVVEGGQCGPCEWCKLTGVVCQGVEWEIHLGCSASKFRLSFSTLGIPAGPLYTKAVADWSCLGQNTLTLETAAVDCSSWPASVTVTPA
jgi:hypothetical protein